MEEVRVTLAVAQVLGEFIQDASRPRYGYDLMQATGFPSGKLYPILQRLARAGVLVVEQDRAQPVAPGRPARRMYRLTTDGAVLAQRELGKLQRQFIPRPALGGI
jgi:PadR family transcriptional regulator, regulatory protein PadR